MELFRKQLFQFQGITLTVGCVLILALVWYFFLRRR
jgi:hypothetical protein